MLQAGWQEAGGSSNPLRPLAAMAPMGIVLEKMKKSVGGSVSANHTHSRTELITFSPIGESDANAAVVVDRDTDLHVLLSLSFSLSLSLSLSLEQAAMACDPSPNVKSKRTTAESVAGGHTHNTAQHSSTLSAAVVTTERWLQSGCADCDGDAITLV